MEYTPENLCGFLIRSRLLTPENTRSAFQRWHSEGRDGATAVHFARWLVARQLITEYQASLLLKGKVDDFFLNQYQILERLGRGRMAGVYKALHSLGQVVAIKVLPPSLAKDAQMLGRFQREARLALQLKHPNVVRSFQTGEARGLHYLVMEYLDGETLEEVLQRRKKLPPQEAVRLIHQALMGLQHIHEMGMVHRDLKPANLMLVLPNSAGDTTTQATVKILDIGLGRELFDENLVAKRGEEGVQLTTEGTILGTPDYLAPEQARDAHAIDVRADIYSLGCVLYHTLTGQPPFPDKNFLNQMVRHATETPKPLKEFNAAIPDGLQQIVSYMLAKKPEQRYATPERAAQALQVFMMADTQPARRLEEVPQMRKYLTWLETGEAGSSEEETLPPQQAPEEVKTPRRGVAAMNASTTASVDAAASARTRPAAATTAPMPAAVVKPASKSRKEATPTPAPVSEPVPEPVLPAVDVEAMPDVDVELVPIEETRRGLLRRLGLSRRDWILLGIGSGIMILIAVVVLTLMVILFGGG